MWWSFPSVGASPELRHAAGQGPWHYDLDAWRSLKVFFYLTDVSPAHGPHRYLRGSHLRHPLRQQLGVRKRLDAAAARAVYGPDAEAVVTGPAGTGFAIDPFGFHAGTPATAGPRLVLEVQFGRGSALFRPDRMRRAYAHRTGRRVATVESVQPPAIAPITWNGSRPSATAGGSG
jgi:hypothetical protein